MKIDNSNILMSSSHNLIEDYEKKESLRMWVGDERPDFEGQKPLPPAKDILVTLSEQSQKAALSPAVDGTSDDLSYISSKDMMKIQLVKAMVEALTGKKFEITILKPPAQSAGNSETPRNSGTQAPKKAGWGVEYDYHESYSEEEQMSFDAAGTVKTADGKDIQFTVNLVMSRKFMTENNINLREGDAKKIDPIVINFNGTGAQLTDTKFKFDLNSDGNDENISFVRTGSGFLVLDKNNDGKINNGKELFGPNTGNGFSELAGYDSDGNGWIDETDPIYNSLRIWSKGPGGNDTLSTLKDKSIGALYLGNIAARFNIKDTSNQSHGEVKSTGIYLNENGATGTMQQVDLTV